MSSPPNRSSSTDGHGSLSGTPETLLPQLGPKPVYSRALGPWFPDGYPETAAAMIESRAHLDPDIFWKISREEELRRTARNLAKAACSEQNDTLRTADVGSNTDKVGGDEWTEDMMHDGLPGPEEMSSSRFAPPLTLFSPFKPAVNIATDPVVPKIIVTPPGDDRAHGIMEEHVVEDEKLIEHGKHCSLGKEKAANR
ncbi:hypothetical protein JX266_003909 [Neoarthrinium moseri]|nr:hypothetical protein JX266_003909 [Neoarthrinium moseri]